MGDVLLQPVVRTTAFLALLTLLPADARLFAEPLLVPVHPVETEEEQQHPTLALVETIPDLDLRRLERNEPTRPINHNSAADVPTGLLAAEPRFPRWTKHRPPPAPSQPTARTTRPAVTCNGPPIC